MNRNGSSEGSGETFAGGERLPVSPPDADLEALERWRGGDQTAGRALFSRHFPSIYRFLENKVGPEADDLAQSTFLACVAARNQFRGHSTFRTYLFTIARHELYSHLRRRAGQPALDFQVSSLADVQTTPSSRLDRGRRADRLLQALSKLPADQQLLLELHYWHEMDAAALAEVFAATPGNIRVRLLRARRALRARLALDGAAPGE